MSGTGTVDPNKGSQPKKKNTKNRHETEIFFF